MASDNKKIARSNSDGKNLVSIGEVISGSELQALEGELMLPPEEISYSLEQREYNRIMERFEGGANPDSDPILDEITYEFRKNRTLVRSSGVLNIVQRKVLNILIWNAFNNIESGKMCSISIEDFEQLMGGGEDADSRANAYANRKYWLSIAVSLRKTEILLFTDDINRKDDMVSTGLISDIFYNSEKGILTYAFNKITAGLIRDAAFSAQLDVRLVSEIKNKYSLAMLEICASYLVDGATPWWPVEVWRRDLGANEDSYKDFRYFNAKVLKQSLADVEEKGGMRLVIEKRTVNRKVAALRMVIEMNDSGKPGVVSALAIKKSPIFIALIDLHVSPAVATDGILHSMDMCSAIVTACKEGMAEGKILKPGAWCAQMIRGRITPSTKASQAALISSAKKSTKPPKINNALLKREEVEKKTNSIARAFNRRLVDEHINRLTPQEVVDQAGYFLHEKRFIGNRDMLLDAVRNAINKDGSIERELFDLIVKSGQFRTYLAGIADPGAVGLRAEVLEKIGDQGLEFISHLID